MTLSEKVSYLKGVAEGLEFDPQASKEAKLLSIMMDVLEHMALAIEESDDSIQSLADQVDDLSDAVADLEASIYDDEDEEWDEEDGEILGEDEFFEMECPHCQDVLVLDQGVLDSGRVTCPNCQQLFEVELSYEDADEENED